MWSLSSYYLSATSWNNVLSYSGCLPQSRLRVQESASSLPSSRYSTIRLPPRIQSHLLAFPSVRGCPALGSHRGEQRAFIRRPSANSADRSAAMMTTGSADTLVDALTHFTSSSVILVVPDGIDSLRNETTSNRARSISSTATRVGNSRSPVALFRSVRHRRVDYATRMSGKEPRQTEGNVVTRRMIS